jgi:hypothetical protein
MRTVSFLAPLCSFALLTPTAFAQTPAAPAHAAPAPAALPPAPAALPPEKPAESPMTPVPMKGKWSPVFYGIAELDVVHDSTQSFQEPAGNGPISRDETFAGQHGRTQFGVRNSRFGVRLTSPEYAGIKVSGNLEFDLLGNQPANPPGVTEVQFFTNATMRLRHFLVRAETPYVDLLAGQYWQLFGWQPYFHPSGVEIQGMPGQIFSRAAQFRISKTVKTDAVTIDAALAALHPPQRDSETPDGQAGVRLSVNSWKGLHTLGGANTLADSLAVGVSGAVRRFALPEHIAVPVGRKGKTGWGLSIDAMLPIIPASLDERGNALTLVGSFVTGSGTADLYSGMGNPPAPAYPAPATGAALAAPVDPGLVVFDAAGELQTIDVTSYIVGLQYYLPPAGRIWASANYSHVTWGNIDQFGLAPGGIFTDSDWFDGNLFFDLTPAVRFGLEYAFFQQKRGDGQKPKNARLQFSTWYVF